MIYQKPNIITNQNNRKYIRTLLVVVRTTREKKQSPKSSSHRLITEPKKRSRLTGTAKQLALVHRIYRAVAAGIGRAR